MKLTVLMDNNTFIDQYYLGEPAVSYYIEDGESKMLFDTGYSEAFLSNAEKMGIDLNALDTIVFSHGHNDHTAGFKYFAERFDLTNKTIIAHPNCFDEKVYEGESIGAPFNRAEMEKGFQLNLSKSPIKISPNIIFLGEIPKANDFEEQGLGEDPLYDDSAIVFQSEQGIFIITGCAHSGICNIIEYAKEICNTDKIIGILGGFHLFKKDERLNKTIEYLFKQNIENLYPCHCVSLAVKVEMEKVVPITEVGVGFIVEV